MQGRLGIPEQNFLNGIHSTMVYLERIRDTVTRVTEIYCSPQP
jgi:hypothetical protein